MLQVKCDFKRLARGQAAYRELGTMAGGRAAERAMAFRSVLERLARRFGERQSAAKANGDRYVRTGNQAELLQDVLGAGRHGWPRRPAAVLHGLVLPVEPILPDRPCCPGGPRMIDLDGSSYLAQLNDGPPQSRELGDISALVLHVAPFETLRIVWVGLEADIEVAREDLRSETNGWFDWTGLCAPYADWLAEQCEHLKNEGT